MRPLDIALLYKRLLPPSVLCFWGLRNWPQKAAQRWTRVDWHAHPFAGTGQLLPLYAVFFRSEYVMVKGAKWGGRKRSAWHGHWGEAGVSVTCVWARLHHLPVNDVGKSGKLSEPLHSHLWSGGMIGLILGGHCEGLSEMMSVKVQWGEQASEGFALGRMYMGHYWQGSGTTFAVGSCGVWHALCNQTWVPCLISIFTNALKMPLGSEQLPI